MSRRMKKAFKVTSLISILLSTVNALKDPGCAIQEDNPDRVKSIPGFDAPLPSKWYAGYLDYEFNGEQVHTHYIHIEAEDLGDGIDDKPLIYWSNGGPGASSLFGLLTELGPLILSDESLQTDTYAETGIPTPLYNKYSWTRLGSIVIFDQPAPVGFSYCNDVTDSENCGDISWTDELTSANAYLALQAFYQRFPCLASKELYLMGESYAGIYIPTLARRIVEDESSTIPLVGFAVGDGCLGTETSICGDLSSVGFGDFWNLYFMAGHHQIPSSDYYQVMLACHHHEEEGFLVSNSEDDEKCREAMVKIQKELGGYFDYSLYDECTYRNGLLLSSTNVQGGLNDYVCGGGMVLEEYTKLDQVHEAFNVKADFFETDNAEGDFRYTPTEPDLTGFYKEINGKLRVLIYNGDTDPAITSFAAANWTSHLGLEEEQHWRPWTLDKCKKMGGYVTRYEGNFDFLTIRGAGHMVPTYKPQATFAFIEAWIQDEEYPLYDPECISPNLSTRIELKDTTGVKNSESITPITSMLRRGL